MFSTSCKLKPATGQQPWWAGSTKFKEFICKFICKHFGPLETNILSHHV